MDYEIRFQMTLASNLIRQGGDSGGGSTGDDADADASGVNSGGSASADSRGGYGGPGDYGGGGNKESGHIDMTGYGHHNMAADLSVSDALSSRDISSGKDPGQGREAPDGTIDMGGMRAGDPAQNTIGQAQAQKNAEAGRGFGGGGEFSWERASTAFKTANAVVGAFMGPVAGMVAGTVAGGLAGLTGYAGSGSLGAPSSTKDDKGDLAAGALAGMGHQEISGSQLDSVSGRPDHNKGGDIMADLTKYNPANVPQQIHKDAQSKVKEITDTLDEIRRSFGLRDTILGRRLGRPNIRRRTILGVAA